jgi:hypothetical protein
MQHETFEFTCKMNLVVEGLKKSPYSINVTLTSSQVGSTVEVKLIAPTSTNQRQGKQEWEMWGHALLFVMGKGRMEFPPLM